MWLWKDGEYRYGKYNKPSIKFSLAEEIHINKLDVVNKKVINDKVYHLVLCIEY